MGLRPAKVCRKWKRPFTRTAVTVKRYQYIKGIPGSKLRIFEMGNKKGEFDTALSLICEDKVQIRHNALEAGRVACISYLKKCLDPKVYFFKVRIYPHNVLREHAQAAVAQADRYYDGMRKPFGKPTGVAARIKKGQAIVTIFVDKKNIEIAKEALRRIGMKLPCSFRIEVE